MMATSVDRFVAAMNRMAHNLKMRNTTFRNPHGLTAAGHASTARDLAILARAALRYPRFGAYVSCRQHGCRVDSVDGYHRNVVWKNTNRLLAIAGYDGIKTGTTSAAGACLVSKSRRGSRALILIVLGSRSSDARYTDTRNLYRWAWQSLAHGQPDGK
jgi:D-alanyl-D-alanine carboxypeptidase (penicillin-binding protein 5/6)